METSKRCPQPPEASSTESKEKPPKESLVQKNKPRKPEEKEVKPEKVPEKYPRQQELEKRFKGTAWKVTDINTVPVYRPITLVEKIKYADLSDAAAAAKGIVRKYDEKGKLVTTEIVENDDHEMTLELGGDELKKKLPKEVKDFMKAVDIQSGPYVNIHGVRVAADGSADLSKVRIRATDRDYPVESYIYKQEKYAVTREPTLAYTQDLEDRCRKILAEEGLTQASLAKMEKTAIELYQQQSAIRLDSQMGKDALDRDKAVKEERSELLTQWQEKNNRSYGKQVEKITDNWVKMAKKVLGSNVSKFVNFEGNNWRCSLVWSVAIKDMEKHGDKYRVYIDIDINDGSIKDFETQYLKKSEGLVRETYTNFVPHEMDIGIFRGKIISKEVLHDVKDKFVTVILPEYYLEYKNDAPQTETLVNTSKEEMEGGDH